MIAVIIDSNIFYNDPLWRGAAFRKLLKLSEQKVVKILISSVVIEEVKRNAEKLYDENIKKVKDSIIQLSKVSDQIDLEIYKMIPLFSINEIENKFNILNHDHLIEIIHPNDGLIDELLHRAIHKIRPFSEKKEEFRDATIWLSCINHIKRFNYEKAYLISKNTSDFSEYKNQNILHKDLKKDFENTFLERNINDFLEKEKDNLEDLIDKSPYVAMKKWLESLNLDEQTIYDFIIEHFYDDIESELDKIVDLWNPSDFVPEIYSGYINSYKTCDELINLENESIKYDLNPDFVTVSCLANSFRDVEIYKYNPVYDDSSEKYSFESTITVKIILNLEYSISPEEQNPEWIDISIKSIVEQ